MVKYLSLVYALIVACCTSAKAQSPQYKKAFHPQSKFIDNIFHPQTNENISVMRKSKQKTQIAISTKDNNHFDTVSVKTYDKNGRLLTYIDSGEYYITKYLYDDKGRVVEYLEAEIYPNFNATYLHFSITYNENGDITSINNAEIDTPSAKVFYNNANKTFEVQLHSGEEFYYKYKLNRDNKLLDIDSKYGEQKPYTTKVNYDRKARPVKENGATALETGAADFTTYYTYNNGNLIKEVIEEERPKSSSIQKRKYSTEYTYSGKFLTNIITTVEVGEVTFKTQSTYLYDSENRLIKMVYKELKTQGSLESNEVNYIYK